jgi:hypothetical protein
MPLMKKRNTSPNRNRPRATPEPVQAPDATLKLVEKLLDMTHPAAHPKERRRLAEDIWASVL